MAAPQGTATLELAALANPETQGYLLAQIPIAGVLERFYTVEARLRVGYDRALPADAVLIHEVDPTRDPPAKLINHLGDGDTRAAAGIWQPGDVFIDAVGGVAVAVRKRDRDGVRRDNRDRRPVLAFGPRQRDHAASRGYHLCLAAGAGRRRLRTPG